MWRAVDRELLAGPVVDVAPRLLNTLLMGEGVAGRVVEVEAYRQDDPASHSFAGLTERTRVMFGPPGHLYVYFSYGMHWCANVSCGPEGHGAAVLFRALEPVDGLEAMRGRRPKARRDRDLCSGPAKLTQALGIGAEHNGLDLLDPGSPVRLVDDGTPPPDAPAVSTRIGITKAVERPWRWFVRGSQHVSRGRPSGRESRGRGATLRSRRQR